MPGNQRGRGVLSGRRGGRRGPPSGGGSTYVRREAAGRSRERLGRFGSVGLGRENRGRPDSLVEAENDQRSSQIRVVGERGGQTDGTQSFGSLGKPFRQADGRPAAHAR